MKNYEKLKKNCRHITQWVLLEREIEAGIETETETETETDTRMMMRTNSILQKVCFCVGLRCVCKVCV